MANSLRNLIRGEISRFQSRHNKEMVGFIDSYNPQDHTAKVKYPTELDVNGNPRITGWLPFKTQSGGAGSSWVLGPSVGDQCATSHLEGHSESGMITGFLHNTVDTPPLAQSGEAILRHTPTGNFTKMAQDGSFTIFHKATGNTFVMQPSGAFVTTAGNVTHTVNSSGVTIVAGGVTLAVSSGGVAIQGGTLSHNGHDVGSTHLHTDAGGAGDSGPPV